MLIKYKESLVFRSIAIAIICLFAYNDIAFALAPEKRLAQSTFREQYQASCELVSLRDARQYINAQTTPGNIQELLDANSERVQEDTLTIRVGTETRKQKILFVAIHGLMEKTGRKAISFEEDGPPVIYIDSNPRFFYNEALRAGEKNKIAGKKPKKRPASSPDHEEEPLLELAAAGIEEPLIGQGITGEELDRVEVKPWREVPLFDETIESLRKFLLAGAATYRNSEIGKQLLSMNETLRKYRDGIDDSVLGIIQSFYRDDKHFYMGFARPKKIGLSEEFFDKGNPLSDSRLEALFHELYHATFNRRYGESTHLYALRLQARLFWGLSRSETEWADQHQLGHHKDNKLCWQIYDWKRSKREAEGRKSHDDWKLLLDDLRHCINHRNAAKKMFELLERFEIVARTNRRYPVENRYIMLKAASLLAKEEKIGLARLLERLDRERGARSKLAIVDSILLMLSKKIPKDWVRQQAPNIEGRSVWQVASEIWNPAGGLGRVMQFHGLSMNDLLQKKASLCHLEPYYEGTDYAQILGVDKKDIRKCLEFDIWLGKQGEGIKCRAVCYEVVLPSGIKIYLMEGHRGNSKNFFFTKGLYDYYDDKYEESRIHNPAADKCTKSEFSWFFSRASLEFIRRMEEEKNKQSKNGARKAPIIHFNDGQLGLAPFFRKAYYKTDEILRNAFVAFTTHTYQNRIYENRHNTPNDNDGLGMRILKRLLVDPQHWKYFHHAIGPELRGQLFRDVIDLTSAGIRCADWAGGVSANQVNDVIGYDNWSSRDMGDWSYVDMTAVTNGDRCDITAHKFRELMREACAGDKTLDLDYPTPEQLLKTKRFAKERLSDLIRSKKYITGLGIDGINPNLPLITYSGRVVDEKISLSRAFSEANIRRMIDAGINIVIGANVKSDEALKTELGKLMRKYAGEKGEDKGRFIVIYDIDVEDQRAILAATDIQVQDSEHHTEAAGYTEADAGACGALELAPFWNEGILQAQGIRINPDELGEGNTLIPVSEGSDAYLDILKTVLIDKPKDKFNTDCLRYLAEFQVTALHLSQILDARMTAAEYLRQWSNAIDRRGDSPLIDYSFGITEEDIDYLHRNVSLPADFKEPADLKYVYPPTTNQQNGVAKVGYNNDEIIIWAFNPTPTNGWATFSLRDIIASESDSLVYAKSSIRLTESDKEWSPVPSQELTAGILKENGISVHIGPKGCEVIRLKKKPLSGPAAGAAAPPAAGMVIVAEQREIGLGGLSPAVREYVERFPKDMPRNIHNPRGAFTGLVLEAMERIRPLFRGAEVLDVGTGNTALARVSLELFGASHVVATDLPGYPFHLVEQYAPKLTPGVAAGLEILTGDLFEPIHGRKFDIALCNADNGDMGRNFIKGAKEVLRQPNGIALLMRPKAWEDELCIIAQHNGLFIAPILKMTYPNDWCVFAITHTPKRLEQIQKLAAAPAQTAETPADGEGAKHGGTHMAKEGAESIDGTEQAKTAEAMQLAYSGIEGEEIMNDRSENARKCVIKNLKDWAAGRTGLRGLNIGSGPGVFSSLVESALRSNIIDIDLTPRAGDAKRADKFINGDACYLPVEAASQDFILSTFLFNYVSDRDKAADEMMRVLKDGGRAMMVLHNPVSELFLVEAFNMDPRPYNEQIGDMVAVLKWLKQIKDVIAGEGRIPYDFGPPESRYLHLLNSPEIIKTQQGLPVDIADNKSQRETLLSAIDSDMALIKDLLRMRLLHASRDNAFENGYDIREFFEKKGFEVETQILGSKTGGAHAFGVILDKPKPQESLRAVAGTKAITDIQNLLREIGPAISEEVAEIYSHDPAHVCFVSSTALGLILNRRLGISLDKKDSIHLEIVGGAYKGTGITQWWLALVIDGKRRLLIDPSYYILDNSYKGMVVVGEYNEMLGKLGLAEHGPDTIAIFTKSLPPAERKRVERYVAIMTKLRGEIDPDEKTRLEGEAASLRGNPYVENAHAILIYTMSNERGFRFDESGEAGRVAAKFAQPTASVDARPGGAHMAKNEGEDAGAKKFRSPGLPEKQDADDVIKITNVVPKIKIIVLDWDGTVVDTLPFDIPTWGIIYARIMKGESPHYIPPESEMADGIQFLHSTAGASLYEQIAQIIEKARGRRVGNLRTVEEYVSEKNALISAAIKRNPGEKILIQKSLEFLEELRNRGFKGRIIQTSGASHAFLREIVDFAGLGGMFDEVHGSYPITMKGVPHNKAELITQLKRRYRLSNEEIVMIGDGISDVEQAKDAGAVACAIASDAANEERFRAAGADFIIRSNGISKNVIPHLGMQFENAAGAQARSAATSAQRAFHAENANRGWDFPYDRAGLEGLMQRPITTEYAKPRQSLVAALPDDATGKRVERNLGHLADRIRETAAYRNGKVVLNIDQQGRFRSHITILGANAMDALGKNAIRAIDTETAEISPISYHLLGLFISPVDGRVNINAYDSTGATFELRARISGKEQKILIAHCAAATVIQPLTPDEKTEWIEAIREFEQRDFGVITVKELHLVSHTSDLLSNARIVRTFALGEKWPPQRGVDDEDTTEKISHTAGPDESISTSPASAEATAKNPAQNIVGRIRAVIGRLKQAVLRHYPIDPELKIDWVPGQAGQALTITPKDKKAIQEAVSRGFLFSEYVQAALYDPDFGYYSTGEVKFGPDFLTFAVALSPVYGEMMAEHFYRIWQDMMNAGDLTEEEPFYIVECGAGIGITARDILRYAGSKSGSDVKWEAFFDQLRYVICEVSPKLAAQQQKTIGAFTNKVEIKNVDALNLEKEFGLGSVKGVIFSDELMDAMKSHAMRFGKDGSIEAGIALMALSRDALRQLKDQTGVDLLNMLKRNRIADPADIIKEDQMIQAGLGLKDDGRIFISREKFLTIKKALSRTGMERLEKCFNCCIEGVMAYAPIEYVDDERLRSYIRTHIDEIAAAVARADKDIVINLIPDNDRFISAAAGVLDRGYILTMDAGDTASRMFSKGGNVSTYGMKQEHPYVLGHTGEIDICADPMYTMIAHAGSRAGLDSAFFGPKLSLEDSTPIKITTDEGDARLRESFTATSFLMNIQRQGISEEAIPEVFRDEFRDITSRLVEGRGLQVSQITPRLNRIALSAPQTAAALLQNLAFMTRIIGLINFARKDAEKAIPVWKRRFAENHKMLLQRKEGTHSEYRFASERREPLFVDLSTFSQTQRQRSEDIRAKILLSIENRPVDSAGETPPKQGTNMAKGDTEDTGGADGGAAAKPEDETPNRYSDISGMDRLIVRICVRFFLRKGIYFINGIEDICQEIDRGLAEARQRNSNASFDELMKQAFRTASKFIRDEKRYRGMLQKFRLGELKPTEGDTFGHRLKALRLESGWSRVGLAKRVGMDKSTIWLWETDTRMPLPPNMKKLAGILNVTVSYLIAGMPEEDLLQIRIEDEYSLEYRKLFGLKIRVLRYKLGLLQGELEKKCSSCRGSVSSWELGKCMPDARTMIKLAESLGTTVSHLIAGMPEEEIMNKCINNRMDPEHKALVGLKIKVLRFKHGLTMQELSDKMVAGSTSHISNWENGSHYPSPKNMIALSSALDTTISQLIAGMPDEILMNKRTGGRSSAEDRKDIALKIIVLRYMAGLTRAGLAAKVGVSESQIGNWEAGKHTPHANFISKLTDALNTTVSQFVAGMPEDELMKKPSYDPSNLEHRKYFGLKVKILRYKMRLFQEGLADKLSVKKGKVLYWERGSFPHPRQMRHLAEVLGVPVSRLMLGMADDEFIDMPVLDESGRVIKSVFRLKVMILRHRAGWTIHELLNRLHIGWDALNLSSNIKLLSDREKMEELAAILGTAYERLLRTTGDRDISSGLHADGAQPEHGGTHMAKDAKNVGADDGAAGVSQGEKESDPRSAPREHIANALVTIDNYLGGREFTRREFFMVRDASERTRLFELNGLCALGLIKPQTKRQTPDIGLYRKTSLYSKYKAASPDTREDILWYLEKFRASSSSKVLAQAGKVIEKWLAKSPKPPEMLEPVYDIGEILMHVEVNSVTCSETVNTIVKICGDKRFLNGFTNRQLADHLFTRWRDRMGKAQSAIGMLKKKRLLMVATPSGRTPAVYKPTRLAKRVAKDLAEEILRTGYRDTITLPADPKQYAVPRAESAAPPAPSGDTLQAGSVPVAELKHRGAKNAGGAQAERVVTLICRMHIKPAEHISNFGRMAKSRLGVDIVIEDIASGKIARADNRVELLSLSIDKPNKKVKITVKGHNLDILNRILDILEEFFNDFYEIDTIGTEKYMDLVVELADESGKGSPAKLLEAIKNNEELIRNTLDKNVGIALEGRAEILKELGIFVPVELSTGRCRFADMMHGPDEDYTKTLINRIMPLLNRAIPEEKMPATRELIKAEILDQINCEQVKAIPEGRVLWHIIDRNVIPRPQQDSIITQLNKFYRDHPEANEKILIVDEAKLAQEIAGIREKDDGAIIDVALSDRAQLDAYESLLRENNARPLVFQSEGNFIQFEGVIAALRALESGDLGALLRIYSVMTGKPFNSPPEAIFDPIKFARSFIFDLPRAASVPVDDIPKLNKRLLQLLIAA